MTAPASLTVEELEKDLANENTYELPRDEDDLLLCCFQNCSAPLRGRDVESYLAHLHEHQSSNDKLLQSMISYARPNRITVTRRRTELALSGAAGGDSRLAPKRKKVRVDDHGFDIQIGVEEGEKINMKCPIEGCPKIITGFLYHLNSHLSAHRRATGNGEKLRVRQTAVGAVTSSNGTIASGVGSSNVVVGASSNDDAAALGGGDDLTPLATILPSLSTNATTTTTTSTTTTATTAASTNARVKNESTTDDNNIVIIGSSKPTTAAAVTTAPTTANSTLRATSSADHQKQPSLSSSDAMLSDMLEPLGMRAARRKPLFNPVPARRAYKRKIQDVSKKDDSTAAVVAAAAEDEDAENNGSQETPVATTTASSTSSRKESKREASKREKEASNAIEASSSKVKDESKMAEDNDADNDNNNNNDNDDDDDNDDDNDGEDDANDNNDDDEQTGNDATDLKESKLNRRNPRKSSAATAAARRVLASRRKSAPPSSATTAKADEDLYVLWGDPRFKPFSERNEFLRDLATQYGTGVFRQDKNGDFVCFFKGCTQRICNNNKTVTQNFSRHIARHQNENDPVDPSIKK